MNAKLNVKGEIVMADDLTRILELIPGLIYNTASKAKDHLTPFDYDAGKQEALMNMWYAEHGLPAPTNDNIIRFKYTWHF